MIECKFCLQNDQHDPDFSVDSAGRCNYCVQVAREFESIAHLPGELDQLLEEVRREGKNKKYDVLIGMSGGVDSSYVAHLVAEWDLRPLVVHFDNGWNSELAVHNINAIIKKNGFPLHTLVVDWDEFRDIQKSFIRSGVVDIEMVTDHAITATMRRLGKKHGISFAFSGSNVATESGMPVSWSWRKADLINLKNIHRRFGSVKIKTFPVYSSFRILADRLFGRYAVRSVNILDYIPFKKLEAIETLKSEYGWRPYPGKHYESFFTKFYQAYILPRKFGVDKRISHLSSLIRNGEITREEAVKELALPLYTKQERDADTKYFCKKIGFSEAEFEHLMDQDPVPHEFYGTDERYLRLLIKVYKRFRDFPGMSRLGLKERIVQRYG